jgi:hypothetical protein
MTTNQFLLTYLPSSLKNQNDNDNDNDNMNDNSMK